MNRIVKRHVPVAELPEPLREGLDPEAFVTVEVTVEGAAEEDEPPMSLDEMFALRQNNFASLDEIDEHVRSLRAEWAHRER